MRTNTAPVLLMLFALVSCSSVADALRNSVLFSPPKTKWGESDAMEIPRRDLRWVEFDYSGEYDTYMSSFFAPNGESKQQEPWSIDEEPSSMSDSDVTAPGGAGDHEPGFLKEFEFHLNAKGNVGDTIKDMITQVIGINMRLDRNYQLVFESAHRQRDYDGSLCQPNDCTARWQATYFDVGFKVKAFDLPTSMDLEELFDNVDFAVELRSINNFICGAQLVRVNEHRTQKRRQHDKRMETPRAFDRKRKYGEDQLENKFMSEYKN